MLLWNGKHSTKISSYQIRTAQNISEPVCHLLHLSFFRILRKIFPYGIIFHPGQIAVIKRALVSENPLVFLPVKQSSMDSVIVQRLLSKEFKLPTIQVKESLVNDSYLSWLWNLFQNAYRYGR